MSSLFSSNQSDESEWISISDLMAGLMLIFLLIAIVYIRVQVEATEQAQSATVLAKVAEAQAVEAQRQATKAQEQAIEARKQATEAQEQAIEARKQADQKSRETEEIKKQIKEIAIAWQRSSDAIASALRLEFADDMKRWNAELDEKNLTIRFNAPEVLFRQNSAILEAPFKSVLADFFPRYLEVLREYLEVIDEVRIEGHSSSEWAEGTDALEAFFENMELSQDRTRAVLQYSLELEGLDTDRDWATKKLTANGLSSSRIVLNENGTENPEASRRVEFKVRTKTEEQIVRILESVE